MPLPDKTCGVKCNLVKIYSSLLENHEMFQTINMGLKCKPIANLIDSTKYFNTQRAQRALVLCTIENLTLLTLNTMMVVIFSEEDVNSVEVTYTSTRQTLSSSISKKPKGLAKRVKSLDNVIL